MPGDPRAISRAPGSSRSYIMKTVKIWIAKKLLKNTGYIAISVSPTMEKFLNIIRLREIA